MPVINNSFETGLAPGTSISVANSDDGDAGDPFQDVVQGGSGGGITYDNTHAAHGTLSAKFTQGATPQLHALYTDFPGMSFQPSGVADWWARFYYWADGHPANTFNLFVPQMAVDVWFLNLTTTSTLNIQDQGFVSRGTTSALTLSAWNRIEVYSRCGTGTSGFVQLAIYSGDSMTLAQPLLNSTGGNFGSLVHGISCRINATAASHVFWIDDMHLNDFGFPGAGPGPKEPPLARRAQALVG